MLVRDDLVLYQKLDDENKIEQEFFDFEQLDMEEIINDAQNRLLNIVVKRQNTNLTFEEIYDCIRIPMVQSLMEILKHGK
jgi:hypothetical protein